MPIDTLFSSASLPVGARVSRHVTDPSRCVHVFCDRAPPQPIYNYMHTEPRSRAQEPSMRDVRWSVTSGIGFDPFATNASPQPSSPSLSSLHCQCRPSRTSNWKTCTTRAKGYTQVTQMHITPRWRSCRVFIASCVCRSPPQGLMFVSYCAFCFNHPPSHMDTVINHDLDLASASIDLVECWTVR